MFYKLIEKKRDEWLASEECTVRDLIDYITERGQMRDAQLEAIKTYLYLKTACHNQPLWKLFTAGTFNSLDLSAIRLPKAARRVLEAQPAAAALLEYSRLTDRDGNQLAPALEHFIKTHPEEIDYEGAFKRLFYGVGYTDYLFSLPMGAGKTFLMAAFIYIDLYFASQEPDNPCFAHNFMIFAPSGLKSSIVPSLKHIMEFNPSWVVPQPMAQQLKQAIQFEILDEQKTAGKSNLTRNPNAQKLYNHQPLETLIGLVAITNAEKVILDRIDKQAVPAAKLTPEEERRVAQANELRSIIGRIPSLAIYIDEVHHAAEGDIKLRQVVEEWTKYNTFNAVLGFSGTPYLTKAEKVALSSSFSIKNTDLANVVSYYPLIRGIDNFLKDPVVMYADSTPEMIISNGVRDFLNRYKDTTYANGACAKLAIYCGSIETLEEVVYPQVVDIMADYGLDTAKTILKYHGGNKAYPRPADAELQFAALDTDLSEAKVILLVQIGKEGWDCKSLTGVILPQKGVCPTNMVLQTSCRCLRQVTRHEKETALIWLNQANADTLNIQLKQQQNITLHELNTLRAEKKSPARQYDRTQTLRLPDITTCQLSIVNQTVDNKDTTTTEQRLASPDIICHKETSLIIQGNMEGQKIRVFEALNEEDDDEGDEALSLSDWLFLIAKESMGGITYHQLLKHKQELSHIFDQITQEGDDGTRTLDNRYDQAQTRSNIRRAFFPKREVKAVEHSIVTTQPLLRSDALASTIEVADERLLYPDADEAARICVEGDMDNTFHYLPYRFNNLTEQRFFTDTLLQIDKIKSGELEVYYNGDTRVSGFYINCHKKQDGRWKSIGRLYPTFVIIKRTADRSDIDKMLMIENQQADHTDKEEYIKTDFMERNEAHWGKQRFDFLYLENTLNDDDRKAETLEAIQNFFI